MRLICSLDHPDLILGLVAADGVAVGPSPPGLLAEMERVAAAGGCADEGVRSAVRDLLRRTGFKPSGRSKPASEYLAAAVKREGGKLLPICNAVDVNNLVSLESGLPISVVDSGRLGEELEVRVGAPGEKFAFNRGEGFVQEIDVESLIVLARPGGAAIGSPVKDSVDAKLGASTTSVAAVLYGARKAFDDAAMRAWCERYAALLREHVRPASCSVSLA